MKLYFTTWNVYIQDGCFDEWEVGNTFKDNLTLSVVSDFKSVAKLETTLKHLSLNHYEISCYVYRVIDDIAFVASSGLLFTIEADGFELIEGHYYSFKGAIYHDIWNDFSLSEDETLEQYGDELDIGGTIKSIIVDTSKYIQISEREWSKIGVVPAYDVSIQKTSCWDDEEYSNGSVCYLLEIDIGDNDLKRKKMLLDNEELVQRIKECYPYGVFEVMDWDKLDYGHALDFNKALDEKRLADLGFKPARAEMWSGDAQKRIEFAFEPLEEKSVANQSMVGLSVYISAVYPAMLIKATEVGKDKTRILGVRISDDYEENESNPHLWTTLIKKLKSIASEQNIMIYTTEVYEKTNIPFVKHYNYLGDVEDDEDEDDGEFDFLDELPSKEAIRKLKSYPAENILLIDCLFAQDYYFI